MLFWGCYNCIMFIVNCPTACPHPVHPPTPMWCVAVSCYVLPPTLSMGLPSCRCCWSLLSVCVRKLSYFSFLGKQLWFYEVFIFILFFVTISIQHRFRNCLGNAAHPPYFSQELHALYSLHGHTHSHRQTEMYTHPPVSYPLSVIHTPYIQKPSHPLIRAHTPTNPSQFLQIPIELSQTSKAVRKYPQL